MRDGAVRDGAEKNAGVRELQMQIEFDTETEFNGVRGDVGSWSESGDER